MKSTLFSEFKWLVQVKNPILKKLAKQLTTEMRMLWNLKACASFQYLLLRHLLRVLFNMTSNLYDSYPALAKDIRLADVLREFRAAADWFGQAVLGLGIPPLILDCAIDRWSEQSMEGLYQFCPTLSDSCWPLRCGIVPSDFT